MRWQDNLSLKQSLEYASSMKDADTISVTGWICLDPQQLNVAKKQTVDDYNGVPSVITFLYACLSLIEDASKYALGPIKVFQGSIAKLSKELKSKDNDTPIVISCATQYTPFAHNRIQQLKKDWGDSFITTDDHSLLSPETLMEIKDKKEYLVYSPFYNLATTLRPQWKPKKTVTKSVSKLIVSPSNLTNSDGIAQINALLTSIRPRWKPRLVMRTTRKLGLQILRTLKKNWSSNTYSIIRNDINKDTSKLARFLNSGVISIREVWNSLGNTMPAFERQLVFRSFYACRMNAQRNPTWKPNESLTVSELQSPTWNSIRSGTGKQYWNAWKTGTTGVPIVDAAMRCLNETGWLHNRLRMVVASYLTRILRINWRYGESWFAQHLFDYDATQNHYGWKGQASMTKDGADYFRVMNPWLQASKYDPDTVFIHKWIPELKDVTSKDILEWEYTHESYKDTVDYPKPLIADHKTAAKKSITIWKSALYSE